MTRRNASQVEAISRETIRRGTACLLPAALFSFFLAAGCGGGSSSTTDVSVKPVIRSVSINEATSTLFIQGENFSTASRENKVFIDNVDMTDHTIWSDNQLTVKALPVSGPGSHGDIQVFTHGVFFSNAVQLSEWRGKITVTARDLLNYVGEQTVGTYDVHWRANIGKIYAVKTVGAQSAKDSTCSCDASGIFNGPEYIETISRAGDPNLPVSFLDPSQIDRFFDASVTFDISHAGSGTDADPLDYSRYTMLINCTAKDQNGINATRVSRSNGAINTYTKFLVNTGITEAIPGQLDSSFNIKAGSWTSSDGSTTVTWENMRVVSPPKIFQ